MGIYQRLDLVKHKSRWILLQPSGHVLELLRNFVTLDEVKSTHGSATFRSALLLPHVFILTALARNWSDYIESQQSKLDELVCNFLNLQGTSY